MIKLTNYKYYSGPDKVLFWFVLLLILQFIQLVFNSSFYVFPIFLYTYFIYEHNKVKFFTLQSILALFFGLGAVLSYFHSTDTDSSSAVIFNYLYWTLILIVFSSLKDRLNIQVILEAVLLGVVLSTLYFHVIQHLGITSIPIFQRSSQNAFSFLIICFAPVVTYTFMVKNGRRKALVFGILLIVLSFLSGSRAGSILVSIGVSSAYFINYIKFNRIVFIVGAVYIFATFLLDSQIIRQAILSLNERTYDLVYDYEYVLSTDRSYLIRRTMVEKGLEIFEDNKLYGIGLNTFQGYNVFLPGEFVGSEYVIGKVKIMEIGSHKSYINILAEGGLFLFIPFILIILSSIVSGVLSFFKLSNLQKVTTVSLILMSVHLYFITAILNVMAWFVLAFGFVIINLRRSKI